MKLDFRYPDWSGIIAKIKADKRGGSQKGKPLDAPGIETAKQ